jgi:hypothetical protein
VLGPAATDDRFGAEPIFLMMAVFVATFDEELVCETLDLL